MWSESNEVPGMLEGHEYSISPWIVVFVDRLVVLYPDSCHSPYTLPSLLLLVCCDPTLLLGTLRAYERKRKTPRSSPLFSSWDLHQPPPQKRERSAAKDPILHSRFPYPQWPPVRSPSVSISAKWVWLEEWSWVDMKRKIRKGWWV